MYISHESMNVMYIRTEELLQLKEGIKKAVAEGRDTGVHTGPKAVASLSSTYLLVTGSPPSNILGLW